MAGFLDTIKAATLSLFPSTLAENIQRMMRGIVPGAVGHPPQRGTREFLQAYSTMPWLRAVTGKVAAAFATTEWKLYIAPQMAGKDDVAGRRARRRLKQIARMPDPARSAVIRALAERDELQEVESHFFLDILGTANTYLTGLSLRKLTQIYIDISGEAFWMLERNGLGKPIGVWPLPPHWIMSTPTPQQPMFRISYRGWQDWVPDTEILWFSEPDPENPYARGSGTARSLSDELETDEYIAKHCHDDQTEALTRRGWVKGLELREDDEIATWNEALSRIEYHKPYKIYVYDHDGLMHHWAGPRIDAKVTPNHRLWIERRQSFNKTLGRSYYPYPEPWHFEESREAFSKPGRPFQWRDAGYYDGAQKQVVIPAVQRVPGGGRPPMRGVNDPLVFDAHEFAPFLGYYVSEGSRSSAGVHICQTEGRYVDDIRNALKIFPPDWIQERSERSLSGKRAYRWAVNHKGLADWMRKNVGDGAHQKRLPTEVFEWPHEAQKSLLTALINGDGTWRPKTGAEYFSANSLLIDDVQRLAVHIGWSSRKAFSISPEGRAEHRLSMKINRSMRHIYAQNGTWAKEVHYSGKVWCVAVPNETFFSRRGDCVMLGGNTRQFFFNRARPELIIWSSEMSEEEMKRVERDWLSRHLGFWRAFKPYFINRELKVHELEQSFRSFQLVQLREHERNVILQTYGMPPELMGVLSQSNRSTIESADYLFSRWVVVPRLEFFRAVVQERFLPLYDDRLLLQYVSPVAEDKEYLKEIVKSAPWAFQVDEIRHLAGFSRLKGKGGTYHAVPVNMYIVPALGGSKDSPVTPTIAPPVRPFGDGSPSGGTPPNGEPPRERPRPKPAARAELASAAMEASKLLESKEAKLIALRLNKQDDIDDELPALVRLAAKLEPSLRTFLLTAAQDARRQIDMPALTTAIQRVATLNEIERLSNVDGLARGLDGLAGILRQAFFAGHGLAATALRDATGVPELELTNPEALGWITGRAAKRVLDIEMGARTIVQRIFVEHLEEPERAARLIQSSLGLSERQAGLLTAFNMRLEEQGIAPSARTARYGMALLRYRAEMTARTEMQAAAHAGQDALWIQALALGYLDGDPAATRKRWVVTMDDLLDTKICEPLADLEVGILEEFPGGYLMPPTHPHCRCSVRLVIGKKSVKRIGVGSGGRNGSS